ncbi:MULTISPECIES: LysR family transcriptional regulator [Pseudomonas]|uniref:LysR family transcriptional regulator n=1 Tax=Pseudomonas TaxID=286 RepID=UPI001F48EE9C|nr:LysR family transcriptional regulator [Pseudomonas sputi]
MDILESMAIFVRVVERGSFSAVAREIGSSQPTISKQIGSLEKRLGGRLFARSTRQLSMTDEGQRYYQQCREILAAVENAEHTFQSGQERIAGTLRVASSGSFGRIQIASRLRGFLELYPEVSVDLQLNDENVDLVSSGADVAIRIGELKDSSLIARQIGLTRRRVFAAPAYLERFGSPSKPKDLTKHNCLVFNQLEHFASWRFEHKGKWESVQVSGNVRSNNSEAVRQMVLDGLGVSLSPLWLFRQDLLEGRVMVLLESHPPAPLPIHAVSPPDRKQSARVRAFTDYLRDAFALDTDICMG